MKPHIKIDKTVGTTKAIVCGSPERAEFISRLMKGSVNLAKNREYHSYLGTFNDAKILVTSHGVGSAGAAICFQELGEIGITTIVRLGTAGGLLPNTKVSDIVVPTAAIRGDGVSSLMVPVAFPAVPDLDLTQSLISELKRNGKNIQSGIVFSTDMFYTGLLDNQLAFYAKANAIAVEMECATLFVIGSLGKIQTGSVVVLDGNPLRVGEADYDPSPDRLRDSIEYSAKAILQTLSRG